MSSFPECVVIPGINNKMQNCLQVNLPSPATLVLVFILYWIVLVLVAYLLYWGLQKMFPQQGVNYWLILLVLVGAMLISGLLQTWFMR